jgi:cell wall-associated NlpC family hydrolase
MGNLASETAHTWNPEIIQGGGTTKDPSTVTGSTGWGLVQWTPGSKALDVAKAFSITTPIYELSTQLNMVWEQMQPGSAYAPSSHWSLTDFKATTNLADAANYFNSNFEISADTSNARATNAQQELEKYQGGGGAAGGTQSSCSISVDCPSAEGSAKILCAAQKYTGIYYEWAGGHQARDTYLSACPDPSNPPDNQPHGAPIDANGLSGNPSPCAVDCSGLVSMAVDDAFNQKFVWAVADIVADSANWKKITLDQAQPGDVVTRGTEHVEIFVSLNGSTLTTFGSHETGTKTGQVTTTPDKYDGVYHYIGPGGN